MSDGFHCSDLLASNAQVDASVAAVQQQGLAALKVWLADSPPKVVEEKRTPLQLSMDELAKKLSMFSFGVIGFICIICVLHQRSWLVMFPIGGV